MKPFTAAPLNAQSVAARLRNYKFFARPSLDVAVARNAVQAVKAVAGTSSTLRETPQALRGVVRAPSTTDVHELARKVCSHASVLAHLRTLWPDLLLGETAREPVLAFDRTLDMLRRLVAEHRSTGLAAVSAVLRAEAARGRFANGVRLLAAVHPRPLRQVCAPPLLLTGCATVSFACWSAAPLVAMGLGAFWMGLAVNAVRLPRFPGVVWNPSRFSRVEQLQHVDRLRLASALVTAFEELGPVSVQNFHWRPQTSGAQRETEHADTQRADTQHAALVPGLRELGIETDVPDSATLYADYWSDNYASWSSVEWHEPDQDPATILVRRKLLHEIDANSKARCT